MKTRREWRRWFLFVSACGLGITGGCMAVIERGLDMVLSPSAAGNLSGLSYAPLAGLAGLLARLG